VSGVVGMVLHTRTASRGAHQQLMEFRASLTLGLSQSEVEQLFKSAQPNQLRLSKHDNTWVVATPREFGASNWHLYLFFEAKSLSRISVRSLDVPTERAPGAPPDLERK
jgi:hypothetical protein